MAWCEPQGVEYVLGIAQNPRLKRSLAPELEQARQACERTGQAARVFKDFRYRTLDSWSRERRVIGKAEHLPRGANPRFVVTSLGPEQLGGAGAVRGGVLRAGGDGEPHQGTAAGAIRRSHLGADAAGQPVAPVFFRLRLRTAGGPAGAGAWPAHGWRGRKAARSASSCSSSACGSGSAYEPYACRSMRASPTRAFLGRCWPASRACLCTVSRARSPRSCCAPCGCCPDHCVPRPGSAAKRAQSTADLALLTKPLLGSPPPNAMSPRPKPILN